MGRAWAHVTLPCLLLAVALSSTHAAHLRAQQTAAKPHTTAVARLILLPAEVVTGAPAMLAVLDAQGRLLPDVTVDLSDGQKIITDETGRALFRGPEQLGALTAKAANSEVSAMATVVASGHGGAPGTAAAQPGTIRVTSYPKVLAIHDRFTLQGSGFQGIADSNHVSLNGDPCLIVASSPASLVALPGPHVPVGEVTLRVAVGGMEAGQFPVSSVLLDFSGPTEAINAGSNGTLTLHAHGTMEPLLVEIRNGSPSVIQLSKGNVQRVKTSGGEDNVAPVDVKFVAGGNYLVVARLLSAEAGTSDPRSAQKQQKN
jgi:IPT/TIG domain